MCEGFLFHVSVTLEHCPLYWALFVCYKNQIQSNIVIHILPNPDVCLFCFEKGKILFVEVLNLISKSVQILN